MRSAVAGRLKIKEKEERVAAIKARKGGILTPSNETKAWWLFSGQL
jgi:hypothetical protein